MAHLNEARVIYNVQAGGFDMAEKAKHYLLIVNDGPYGNERPFNALRIAMNLVKRESARSPSISRKCAKAVSTLRLWTRACGANGR